MLGTHPLGNVLRGNVHSLFNFPVLNGTHYAGRHAEGLGSARSNTYGTVMAYEVEVLRAIRMGKLAILTAAAGNFLSATGQKVGHDAFLQGLFWHGVSFQG